MARATWNGTVLVDSDDTVVVEGNQYFAASDIAEGALRPSNHTSVCPWKGTASYYDVVVGDEVNANAAWFYPHPKDAAKEITGRVAFWKGVTVAV